MKRLCIAVLILFTALTASPNVGHAQEQSQDSALARLGPDPFFTAPESLEKLVAQVPAAVVAQVLGPGELQFEEVEEPHSDKRSLRGYASYRIVVRDVLFNRTRKGAAPPLDAGAQIDVRQSVGREGAQAFTKKAIPVAAGDECLLFLWLRPHGWDILNWHLQFRQSRETPGIAETIGPPGLTRFVNPTWIGPSVKASFVAQITKPDWAGLVTEVRRLGAGEKR